MRFGICTLLLLLVGCNSAPQRGVTNEHALGPGDRLGIVITNRECPDIREVVDASGDISLPLVGKVRVGGMSLKQAAKAVESAYWPSCFREPINVSLLRL